MYSRRNMLGSMGGGDGYGTGSKRQRVLDGDPYYFGHSSGLHAASYGYEGGYHVPGPFPVVRLRGLPFNCSESDIAEFLAGLDLVDVLLVRKQGRFSGDAFVVLNGPMQAELALMRNRLNMGRRYVEVFKSKKQEYYGAIVAEVKEAKVHPNDELVRPAPDRPSKKPSPEKDDVEHTGVLRLRGLPFSVSKREIMEFFSEFGLDEENIHIVRQSDGRTTGEAFVEFKGPEESRAAMKKDKMTIGSRYVEIFPSSREEATRAAARSKP